MGHDSHGVIRVPAYVDAIRAGTLAAAGPIRVVMDFGATLRIDCGQTFGQVAVAEGMAMALARARQFGVGVAVLGNCDHTGRVGEYAVQAAQAGMMGLVFCNGSLPGGLVAPYGGIGRALGANPLAWGMPGLGDEPIFLDFATSAIAQGKVQVAADKGELIDAGLMLDTQGQPTRNPQDQLDGGALLPFGGHKGYALSVMIEVLAGALSGVGFPLQPDYHWNQGTVLIALNLALFLTPDEFRAQVTDFATRLKATPRAPGVEEILLPGEPEWRTRARRLADGIPFPEATWVRLAVTARELGVMWA